MSDQVPLTWLFTALAVMLLIAGFFSIAITLSLLIFVGGAVRDALDPRKTFR